MSPLVILGMAAVFLGTVPLLVAAVQTLAVTFHRRRYLACVGDCEPRVAVLIPAWNEAPVLTTSVARMLQVDYPADRLRVYVIDDASTDTTPAVMSALIERLGDRVHHIRREEGGQGKAHTLNAGLEVVLADDWAEAILITDSDVLFTRESIRRMTRHLADPAVGAVTGYVKEGSQPARYVNRFIAYEYATAQAVARRAMNMLGAQACLAGGAQLHRRANLEAIGGRIDTTTLAEDTVTTFETQLRGNRVVFEPNAVVFAEEPAGVRALWSQRLRWSRGNLQVTHRYRWLWFHRHRHRQLGSIRFGLSWFVVLLEPFLLLTSSISLILLYLFQVPEVWAIFRLLWILNGIVYVIVIGGVWAVDPSTAKRTRIEGLLFPGLISALLVVYSVFPGPFAALATWLVAACGMADRLSSGPQIGLALFTYSWLTLSMVFAYAGKVVESSQPGRRRLAASLIVLAGYGSLLCAVTFAAVMNQLWGRKTVWVKTEKTGKVELDKDAS